MIGQSAFQIVERSGTRLVIAAPGQSLLSGWLAIVIGILLAAMFYFTGRSMARVFSAEKAPAEVATLVFRYRAFGLGITVMALALFWAASYSSGSIAFDRTAGTVAMQWRMSLFLPARTNTAELKDLEEAVLDSKPNSGRIRLVARTGRDLAYPIWSDRGGQDEAVRTINQFLNASTEGRQ